MNKADLINAVAAKTEVSKKETEAVITATLDAITAAMQQGDKVQLVGFGSFEVKKRAERIGRIPPAPRGGTAAPPRLFQTGRPLSGRKTARPPRPGRAS